MAIPRVLTAPEMDANSFSSTNKNQPDHTLSMTNGESASPTRDENDEYASPTRDGNIRRPKDPFLFYSIDANLQNAMNLKPVDYSNDGSKSSIPTVRKTRLSFEKDPLSLMIDTLGEDLFDVGGSKSSIPIVRDNRSSFENDLLLSLMMDTSGEDFFDLCDEEVGASSS